LQIHGKVLELAGHHTASRIIQFCAKYGSEAQRSSIMAEVKAVMVELSKGKHGHHLVQKLIAVSKKEDVPSEKRRLCTNLPSTLHP
jgi:pumilio family protein 6